MWQSVEKCWGTVKSVCKVPIFMPEIYFKMDMKIRSDCIMNGFPFIKRFVVNTILTYTTWFLCVLFTMHFNIFRISWNEEVKRKFRICNAFWIYMDIVFQIRGTSQIIHLNTFTILDNNNNNLHGWWWQYVHITDAFQHLTFRITKMFEKWYGIVAIFDFLSSRHHSSGSSIFVVHYYYYYALYRTCGETTLLWLNFKLHTFHLLIDIHDPVAELFISAK